MRTFLFLNKEYSHRDYRLVMVELLDVAPQTVEQLYQWCVKYNLPMSEVQFVESFSDDTGVGVKYLQYVEATTDDYKKQYDAEVERLKQARNWLENIIRSSNRL